VNPPSLLPSQSASQEALQSTYLSLMPPIRRHGEVVFRCIPCQDRKEDAICEMLALAWKWLLSLAERGKDVNDFPATL
jgi:hypothetical protein